MKWKIGLKGPTRILGTETYPFTVLKKSKRDRRIRDYLSKRGGLNNEKFTNSRA